MQRSKQELSVPIKIPVGLITSEELMMCLKHKEVDEEIMHNKKEHSLESFSGYSYRNAVSGSKRY